MGNFQRSPWSCHQGIEEEGWVSWWWWPTGPTWKETSSGLKLMNSMNWYMDIKYIYISGMWALPWCGPTCGVSIPHPYLLWLMHFASTNKKDGPGFSVPLSYVTICMYAEFLRSYSLHRFNLYVLAISWWHI